MLSEIRPTSESRAGGWLWAVKGEGVVVAPGPWAGGPTEKSGGTRALVGVLGGIGYSRRPKATGSGIRFSDPRQRGMTIDVTTFYLVPVRKHPNRPAAAQKLGSYP